LLTLGRVFSKSIKFNSDIADIDYCDAWKIVFVITFEGQILSLDRNTFKILHEEDEKVALLV